MINFRLELKVYDNGTPGVDKYTPIYEDTAELNTAIHAVSDREAFDILARIIRGKLADQGSTAQELAALAGPGRVTATESMEVMRGRDTSTITGGQVSLANDDFDPDGRGRYGS